MPHASRRLLPPLALSISMAIAACSSTEVKVEKDPQSNLAQYKTYAWAPETLPSAEKPASSVMDETVKAAVEQQMPTKGLQKASDPKTADLLISYTAVAQNEVTYGAAPGYWGRWGEYDEAYYTRRGNLTLDFVDPKTRRSVWQGTVSDVVGDAGASQQQVDSAVRDLLKKYPTA